jgi:hypothetical protein
MVPGYSSGLKQGEKMPNDGTAQDGRCVVCGERYSSRYYLNSRGPFCAAHFPTPQESGPNSALTSTDREAKP